MKKVEVEIWELQICGSAIDIVHNACQTIRELYISSENICCNLADGYLHCFKNSDSYRYKRESAKAKLIKSIMVSEDFVRDMKQYTNLQLKIIEQVKLIELMKE